MRTKPPPRAKVAFLGSAGSGKTAMATMYAAKMNGTAGSFARALKEEIATTFQVPLATLNGPQSKPNWRTLMQEWGSARRRTGGPDYWVNILMFQVDRVDSIVAIDDVRYPNEYEALTKRGWTTVRCLGLHNDLTATQVTHSSEIALATTQVDFELPWVEPPDLNFRFNLMMERLANPPDWQRPLRRALPQGPL